MHTCNASADGRDGEAALSLGSGVFTYASTVCVAMENLTLANAKCFRSEERERAGIASINDERFIRRLWMMRIPGWSGASQENLCHLSDTLYLQVPTCSRTDDVICLMQHGLEDQYREFGDDR